MGSLFKKVYSFQGRGSFFGIDEFIYSWLSLYFLEGFLWFFVLLFMSGDWILSKENFVGFGVRRVFKDTWVEVVIFGS